MAEEKIREPKQHDLKCDHDQFMLVLNGQKKFELRYNDRDFQKRDILILHETHYSAKEMRAGKPLIYTGRTMNAAITHIMTAETAQEYGLLMGAWIIMSIMGPYLRSISKERYEYQTWCNVAQVEMLGR